MMEDLPRCEVVTSFLRHGGKIMVVRRSEHVGSYRGCWSGISGYLEEIPPLDQAVKEIGEETGLPPEDISLARIGETIEAPDKGHGVRWIIHPFLFDIEKPERVRLDWENTSLRWIDPEELSSMETVPSLTEALRSCLRPLRDFR